MDAAEFFEKTELEGMDYALVSYFTEAELRTIEDDLLRDAVIRAAEALQDIERIRAELGLDIW